MTKSIYRRQEDVIPSFVVFTILIAQLTIIANVEQHSSLIALAFGFLFLSACPGSISHNHHHYSTFRYPWMNRVYEVILFLQTGVPPYAWTLHHNLGHHKHYLDPKLDPAAWQGEDGKLLPRVKYDLYNAMRIYPEVIRIGQSRPKLLKRFYLWTAISLAVLFVLFLWKPLAVGIIFMAPMPIMLLGLMDNTYHQHQGLDMSSDYTASRNTLSRLYNLISWNLGYHTAHHSRPNVHWSDLPKLHETIKDNIPSHLICNSLFLSDCERRKPLMDIRPQLQRVLDAGPLLLQGKAAKVKYQYS